MKRLLCLLLCLFLILIPFSITASATSSIDDILFFVEYVFDSVTGSNSSATDFDRDDWRNHVYSGDWIKDNLLAIACNPIGMAVAGHENDKMKDSDYQCAKLNKDQLRQLQNAANSAVSGYGKTAKYSSLSDYNLEYYGGFATNGIIQLGSGGPIFYLGKSYNMYTAKVSQAYYLQSTSNTDISIFSGSSGFPVFYVPENGILYQNGIALPSNYWYVPLSSSELIQIQPNTPYLSCFFTSQETLESVTFEFLFVNYHSDSDSFTNNLRRQRCSVFSNGSLIGQIGDESYPGSLVVDRLEKMVGTRINYDGKPTIEPFELPSDIPYDDNDEVVVCVPMGDGNSGEVVYLSPTEYNNYINNGDLIQNDNRVSDYHDEQTVNNISNVVNNITNNYGSSYDDTNLLNKLEHWFGDVNKNLKKIVDRLDTIIDTIDNFNSQPVYANFSDCITKNIPIFGQFEALFSGGGSGGVNSKTTLNSSGSTLESEGINLNLFGIDYNFVIDLNWYEPYRVNIREILKIGAYLAMIGTMWRSLKSIFGVTGDTGSD